MAEADEDKTSGRALAEPAPDLAALSEKARDYARNARSQNTQKAYDADWRQFASWLRRQGLDPLCRNAGICGIRRATRRERA